MTTALRGLRLAAGTALLVVLWPAAPAQDPPRPEMLLTVHAGTLPIILTAPHGGTRPVPGAAERRGLDVPQFVTVRDTHTAELAERVAAELAQRMGGKPHLVVARFERKYVDANRPAESAYESPAAKPPYDAYHAAVRAACRHVRETWGHGLLLDLHGQAARADAVFRGTNDLKTVSFLVDRYGQAAVVGPKGLFGLLAQSGYAVVPANDSNDKEDPRYRGGYTVATHGSHRDTGIDAVQLELGAKFRARGRLDQSAAEIAAAVTAFAAEYLPRTKKLARPD